MQRTSSSRRDEGAEAGRSVRLRQFHGGRVCWWLRVSEKQRPHPQRLKPHSKRGGYRSGEPLRHPKSIATAVFVIACVLSPPGLSIAMLMGVTVSCAACGANVWAITQTVAGPAFRTCFGNLAGIAPAITGFVTDCTGQFCWSFITAAVGLPGAVGYAFVLGPVEQVRWRRPPVLLTKASE